MRMRYVFAAVVVTVAIGGFLVYDNLQSPVNDNYEFIQVAEDFTRPVYLTHAGDERLFVVEQAGYIWVMQPDGTILDEPFLDIRSVVEDGANEQGLLSVAFHPNYAENGYFFVNYTGSNGATNIARFSVEADNPNRADLESAEVLLNIEQPFRNHNGGLIKFGPDGYLYIGMGDGGSGNDPQNLAQNLSSLLGKVLRIDVDGEFPYAIPDDNPFVGQDSVLPEIWTLGWRNPWRFSFDFATGDMFIGDVGQNEWEEVSYQSGESTGGENYGWRVYEASEGNIDDPGVNPDDLVFPIAEYDHSGSLFGGNHCSVTGGYVYRGEDLPALQGTYLFADYCSGMIWTLNENDEVWEMETFMDTDFTISSFGEDVSGELYIMTFDSGIWKLRSR